MINTAQKLGLGLPLHMKQYAIINAVSTSNQYKQSAAIQEFFKDEIEFVAIDDLEAHQICSNLQKDAEKAVTGTDSSVTSFPNYHDHLFLIIDKELNDYRKVNYINMDDEGYRQKSLNEIKKINKKLESLD